VPLSHTTEHQQHFIRNRMNEFVTWVYEYHGLIMKLWDLFLKAIQDENQPIQSSLLHQACRESPPSNARLLALIDQDPDAIKVSDDRKNYPLHVECTCSYLEPTLTTMIQLFPLAVKHKNMEQEYPLHIAIQTRQSEDVIIKSIELYPQAVHVPGRYGHYAIHHALSYSQSEAVIMKLLEIYPSVATKSVNTYFALHMACSLNQSLSVIQKLVELYPLALNKMGQDCMYPIHVAVERHENYNVINYLVEVDPLSVQERSVATNGTALHYACAKHKIAVVEYLIQQPKSYLVINMQDQSGWTPLYHACYRGFDQIVKVLLQHRNINVNARHQVDNSLIHMVTNHNRWMSRKNQTIRNIPAINYTGNTPLHIACQCGREKVVEVLLQHRNVLAHAKNRNNETPLHMSLNVDDPKPFRKMFHLRIVQLLLTYPTNLTELEILSLVNRIKLNIQLNQSADMNLIIKYHASLQTQDELLQQLEVAFHRVEEIPTKERKQMYAYFWKV
jgi:ankyrin repeat protein